MLTNVFVKGWIALAALGSYVMMAVQVEVLVHGCGFPIYSYGSGVTKVSQNGMEPPGHVFYSQLDGLVYDVNILTSLFG